MNTRLLAIVALLVGFGVVLAGLWWIHPPIAVVVGGAGVMSVGLEELRSKP